MKRRVLTYNVVVGYHRYPDAPEFCSFLSSRHRHNFVIKAKFDVSHNEREIEIYDQQNKVESLLFSKFGNPCEFGCMSCESIAEYLMESFKNIVEVEVLEDNYGGASLSR